MQQPIQHSGWKKIQIGFCALIGGFLLSFLGFGILLSGISWIVQLLMFLPFMLFSYVIFRWSNGSLVICAVIMLSIVPLGTLMTQLRDTNGSHLMPTLMVASWVIGILAGCFWGKIAHGSQVQQARAISTTNRA